MYKTEKRNGSRSLCADLVTLEWVDGSRSEQAQPAVLEDISPRGACLQVETPVPVGLETRVRQGENWSADCRITYCVYRDIGYFVGVEFKENVAWSENQFAPRHLLDIRDLLLSLTAAATQYIN